MQPTSHAAMSGDEASEAGKRGLGAGRSAATTRPRFPPAGLGLDAKGPQAPSRQTVKVSGKLSLIEKREGASPYGEDAPPSLLPRGGFVRPIDKRPDLLADTSAHLAARHPELDLRIGAGRASIHGSFAITDGEGVVDRFQTVIRFPDDYPDGTATFEEVGGRIPRAQERHVEPSGAACLTVPEEWHFDPLT